MTEREDEPIVLDNPELKIDFRKDVTDDSTAETLLRWFTKFQWLLIDVRKSGASNATIVRLHPEHPVTIMLKNSGQTGTATFERQPPSSGKPHVKVTVNLNGEKEFKNISSTGLKDKW